MRVLIAGDYCPQYRVTELIEENKFASVLGDVKETITDADYSIVNFECAVAKGGEKPIEKYGPNLQTTEEAIIGLKWAGFHCVTLANNHFYDYGEVGVKNTLEACEKYGLDYVGGGTSLQESAKILYNKIGSEILAIINCCEHEFSIASEKTGGSNPLNPILQYYAIKEAKKKADYLIVIVHGGHEHFQLPSLRMQETYRFFVDAGADAVVNHHQHCFSGYEVYQGKPIFYGLGNFCFDNPKYKKCSWNEGYMVVLKTGCSESFDIIPYRQCTEDAIITLLDIEDFIDKINMLNNIIEDPVKLADAIKHYYSSRVGEYSILLEPCQNRYYKALNRRGWLPSFISTQRKIRATNFICCESHRDILTYYFEQ